MNISECLFCNKKNISNKKNLTKTTYNKKIFYFVNCVNCQISYISPVPSEDDINKLYSYDNYYKKFYLSQKTNNEDIYFFYKHTNSFFNSSKRILDYGCGDGNLINFFEKKGLKISGADFESEMIKILKKNNSNIFNYNEVNNHINLYDAVLLRDVFEHSTKPINIINSIYRILNKQGIMIIDGPIEKNFSLTNFSIKLNLFIKQFLFKITVEQSPYHLVFFSNKQLIKFILSTNKFILLKYTIYETGWPLKGKGFLKNTIAYLSMALSKILFFSNIYGNRSIVILRKK